MLRITFYKNTIIERHAKDSDTKINLILMTIHFIIFIALSYTLINEW